MFDLSLNKFIIKFYFTFYFSKRMTYEQLQTEENVPQFGFKFKFRIFCNIFCTKNLRNIYIVITCYLLLWIIGSLQCYFFGIFFEKPEHSILSILQGLFLSIIYVSILAFICLLILGVYACRDKWKKEDKRLREENETSI